MDVVSDCFAAESVEAGAGLGDGVGGAELDVVVEEVGSYAVVEVSDVEKGVEWV
jgi:hypothetical protein